MVNDNEVDTKISERYVRDKYKYHLLFLLCWNHLKRFLIISASSKVAELKDLALYLTKQLRGINCSTFLLPSSYILTLEAQFKQYDQIGIPYTVILNEKTLVDGISYLRSRDTTLKVS